MVALRGRPKSKGEIRDTKDEKFSDCIDDCFLFQHITEQTRFRHGQNPSVVDLILTNEENSVGDVEMEASLGMSDHAIITCTIQTRPVQSPGRRTVLLFDRADSDRLLTNLNIQWGKIIAEPISRGKYDESRNTD